MEGVEHDDEQELQGHPPISGDEIQRLAPTSVRPQRYSERPTASCGWPLAGACARLRRISEVGPSKRSAIDVARLRSRLACAEDAENIVPSA